MSTIGRGTSYEIKSKKKQYLFFEQNILKWYDNKPVNMASNFITSGQVEIKKR
jgi:hypothetical protein